MVSPLNFMLTIAFFSRDASSVTILIEMLDEDTIVIYLCYKKSIVLEKFTCYDILCKLF